MPRSCALPPRLLLSSCLFLLVLCLLAPLEAQQFVDESVLRLPQPDPNEYSSQVAIADIDGDGDLDIAFANGRGYASAQQMQKVRILINDGLGNFEDDTDDRTGGLVGYGRDVEFGDVDSDDDLDLVVANDFNTLPRLLINDGAGFFTDESGVRLPAVTLGSPHVSLGDVDNDGDLDLWFANGGSSRFGAGQAQLWLNDGSGFFTDATATNLPAQLVSEPMDCIFGDIDGDFDLDMMEGHRAGNSRLYRNDGTGVFTNFSAGNLPPDSATYSYDFGDLDDDGDLDLLGANSLPGSSREALFINNGLGTFTDQTAVRLPGSNNPNIDDNDSKFFDLDFDGDLDFIIASLGSTERLYLNDGAGNFTLTPGLITAVGDSSLDVELGDLDGDGALDIVTSQGESGVFTNRLYRNTGPADDLPPTFQLEQVQEAGDEDPGYPVRVMIRDQMTSDRGAFFSDTTLVYTVDGGAESTVDLRWMGHDLYRGEIPTQAVGAVVVYRVAATDFAGNSGESPELSFTVGYTNPRFQRGDCNNDGQFDVADAVALLDYLFPPEGEMLDCEDACDGNDDEALDIADAVALLGALFPSGPPVPLPEPFDSCGPDPGGDSLDCAGFLSCP